MNKPNVSNIVKSAKAVLTEHSPEILTGIGIAGMVTTTVLAVKATPKALMLIEEKKRHERIDELPPIEVVKATWKCYIPAAVTGAVSIGCLIGASSVNLRRNAALAAAYTLSETALTEFKDKAIETVGEKKVQAIKEKVAEEKIKKNPVNTSEIIVTEKGNTRCYDSISGRRFTSDIEQIKKVVNTVNKQLLDYGYISLNEFYDELGLEHIKLGDDLGWNTDDKLIEVDFGSCLDEDGVPCIVLDYRVAPKYGFDRFA